MEGAPSVDEQALAKLRASLLRGGRAWLAWLEVANSLLVYALAVAVAVFLLHWKDEIAAGVSVLLAGTAVSAALSSNAWKSFREPLVDARTKLVDARTELLHLRLEVIERLLETQLQEQRLTNKQLELLRMQDDLARSSAKGDHATAALSLERFAGPGGESNA
jgi:ABC-type enterobactin transport system permease subunit